MKQDSLSLDCRAVTTLKRQEKNDGGCAWTSADTTFVATEATATAFLNNPIMLPGSYPVNHHPVFNYKRILAHNKGV